MDAPPDDSSETQMGQRLEQVALLLRHLEVLRGRPVIALIAPEFPIVPEMVQAFNQVLRRMPEVSQLDLLLESSGGDVDSAVKIAKLCFNYTQDFQVLVPFYAKSAASLLALYGKTLVMTKASELGPVDPQVRPPGVRDQWVPAHSVDEAVKFIGEVEEPIVKAALVEKLDPYIIGAYRNAQEASRQYLSEALALHSQAKRDEVVEVFTRRLRSHGYPIDRERCRELGLNVQFPDPQVEKAMEDVQELYEEILTTVGRFAFIVQSQVGWYVQVRSRIYKRYLGSEATTSGALPEVAPASDDG
ncbi:MAG TPA: hypothetical protein GXX55_03260 [Firmicutes bacterium]|nr:hypothetical protein [Bacillota bacterium]